MNLLQRSITSSVYNIAANLVTLVTGLVSSIMLMRLLEPQLFGTFALATTVIQITLPLPNFGFAPAFLNRTSSEGITEGILRVHFTLKLLFSLIWAVVLGLGTWLFVPANTRWLFGVLILTTFFSMQTATITILLTRQVRFQRLAMAQAMSAIARSIIPIILAYRGWGLWALVSGNIASTIVSILLLYIISPVWRPRLGWSQELVGYFIKFGSKVLGTSLLLEALDRVDDLWTGIVLGEKALGFYDKAYGFATYPRQVITVPLVQVVSGTYAELLPHRQRLSIAFSWVNMLMTRANFWIAALLWLVAPEFIRLFLGSNWLPMLDAFRLMLIYTMFDPIKTMIGSLLILADASPRVIRARLIQLGVLIAGLLTLGPQLGIAGVALAVNIMLVTGMIILYAEARRFVDFSLRQALAVPTLSLGLGLFAVQQTLAFMDVAGNDWLTSFIKGGVFSLVYVGVLVAAERKQLRHVCRYTLTVLRKQPVYPA